MIKKIMIKKNLLKFFIFYLSSIFSFGNEIDFFCSDKEEFLDYFLNKDKILINFLRNDLQNHSIKNNEIDLYKKQRNFYLNFFNFKDEEEIKYSEVQNKILLIKENLLNEKFSKIEDSLNENLKEYKINRNTFNFLLNDSNFNIKKNDLFEKQNIIENLKNSNKIEEIQNLIKEYRNLDLKLENKIKFIFSEDKKYKKEIFRFLNFILYFLNINNLILFYTSFIKNKINNVQKNSKEKQHIHVSFKLDDYFNYIKGEEFYEESFYSSCIINFIKTIYFNDFRKGVSEKNNKFVLFLSYFLINDNFRWIQGLSIFLIYKYTFLKNYRLINNIKNEIKSNLDKKLLISNKIKTLFKEINSEKEIELKEFLTFGFLRKNLEKEKNNIDKKIKFDFLKQKVKLHRNENYMLDKILLTNKGNLEIFNYDFDYNKIIIENNSSYMLDNFINFSDSLCILASLKRDNHLFSYPKIIDSEFPVLKIDEMISPEIKNCVNNNVDLNVKDKNMLITGPTGSGKTNYLEQIVKCLKYSNIGIVPAKKMEYTPFEYIYNNTKTKLIDNASKNERECANILDFERYYNKPEFKLILMDEIFSSTTPEQDYYNSKEYLDRFIKDDRTFCILTSHMKEHFKLCEDFKNKMKKYFVLVEEKNEGDFILEFKIFLENKNNEDKNWWFKEGEEFYKKRLRYAIWKEEVEKNKLLNSSN